MFRPSFVLFLLSLMTLSACGGGSPSPSISDIYASPDHAPVAGADGASAPEERVCTPECDGKECGEDGCGGNCGECSSGEHCDPQFICRPGECTPGQVKCQGGGIAACLADGSGWSDATPCPEGEVCAGGECMKPERICTPGQKACAGNAVITCEGDGYAWSQPSGCPAATECVNGACVSTGQKDCKTILSCMLAKKCGQPEPECMLDCFATGPRARWGRPRRSIIASSRSAANGAPGRRVSRTSA